MAEVGVVFVGAEGEPVEGGEHGEFKLQSVAYWGREGDPFVPGIFRDLNRVCLSCVSDCMDEIWGLLTTSFLTRYIFGFVILLCTPSSFRWCSMFKTFKTPISLNVQPVTSFANAWLEV